MSNDLEQRLQEALDNEDVSDELLKELVGQAELEPMIELDAALRSMPHAEFDLSEAVLGRLDEDLDEIPGLFDAPQFDEDSGAAEAPVVAAPAASSTAASPVAASPATTPISLDDARRQRSAAPFMLAAAAVIGLVATGTLMTLNSSPDASMEMAAVSQAEPSPTTVGGMPESYAAEERSAAPAAAAPAVEMPAELAELSDVMQPDELLAEPEAEADQDDSVVAALQYAQEEANVARGMPSAAPRTRMTSARGGSPAVSPVGRSEDTELSASQQRTLARIESCLPDHIRITRVRESSDGRRVVGVETSEPLSDSVDDCVSGVLDTFPQARRRARRRRSMSAPATTSTMIDK